MVMRNREKGGEKRWALYALTDPSGVVVFDCAQACPGNFHDPFMAPESSRLLQSFGVDRITSRPGRKWFDVKESILPWWELGAGN